MSDTELCPCGSSKKLDECCLPIIDGGLADSAEALMRSRYSAYVLGRTEYIAESHNPETRADLDAEAAAQWAEQAEWVSLEVVDSGDEGDVGRVEFKANYRMEGVDLQHHEKSRFCRVDGRWYYEDGEVVRQQPVKRESPKVGRNEPCPCGSGKKFKKCCA